MLVYGEQPSPSIHHEDVLIRVHAAAVNPVDLAVRQGYMAEWVSPTFPYILGCDVSGVIVEIGRDVTSFTVGDEVYARLDLNRNGSYAEYVAAPAAHVVRKPRSIDHIQVAAVPHVALTAWETMFGAANLTAGQAILIHGAAGGVGHIAVQLARWRGARVIGTASGYNHDFLRQIGADEVIDYNTTRFEDVVKGVDVVLDTVGGDTQARSWSTLKPGGTLISIVQPPSDELAKSHGVKASMGGAYIDPAILNQMSALIDAGAVNPFVSKVLPLREIHQAHELIGTRHTRGKIVLQIVQ
jgi:NADPH:quinone reductase-like Zn-dependent oxidoreductase